jgi:cytochrome c-type biogenesis protein CcmH
MKFWPDLPLKSGARLLAAAAFLCTLLMAQSGEVVPITPSNNGITASNDAAFRRVSNRLLCQCGCSYMVTDCNMVECSSAGYIRKTVKASLAAGKSEDAIVAAFIEQYGPRILPEPPKKGFSLTAWIMPFAVLLLGTALVSYVLWLWKSKYRTAEVVAGADASRSEIAPAGEPSRDRDMALVEKYRAQIDRDLENE